MSLLIFDLKQVEDRNLFSAVNVLFFIYVYIYIFICMMKEHLEDTVIYTVYNL